MTQLAEPTAVAAVARKKISRAPTTFDKTLNRSVVSLAYGIAGTSIALVIVILYTVFRDAWPAISKDGLSLMTQTNWDPNLGHFGLLPAIVGTIVSSLLALFIGTVLGLAIAIMLTQDFLPHKLAVVLKNIVDLLAAIPSVVYGLWGLAVVTPLLRPGAETLNENLGWIPIFGTPLGVGGLAPAALVLAIMILPTIAAISRDALAAVHPRIKEAALGLGATRWETILGVILPTASGGIVGAMILGFGRALGETMALAMLMGNRNDLSWSIFSPGNTLAALIANNYKEAGGELIPRLVYAALLLLLITLVVNIIGTLVLQRTARRLGGGRQR